jgi:hypothetical protein
MSQIKYLKSKAYKLHYLFFYYFSEYHESIIRILRWNIKFNHLSTNSHLSYFILEIINMVVGLQHMSKGVLKNQCESLDGFEKMNYIIFITSDAKIIRISLHNSTHVRNKWNFKSFKKYEYMVHNETCPNFSNG